MPRSVRWFVFLFMAMSLGMVAALPYLAGAPVEAATLKPGEEREYEIAPGVKMKFCWIPPGKAQLGSPKAERKAKGGAQAAKGAPAKAKASKKTTPAKNPPKAKKAAKPAKAESGPREGSKTAQVVAMLQRKNGATLEEIMEKMGWQKHTVRGFMAGAMKKAGYKVESFKPDLILLDVMMPKISGFEVCKRIRAKSETRDIIIHMITALDQHHDIDRAVEVGTNDFLTKPINKTELLLRIKAALASRQYPDALDQTLAYIERVQSAV